MSPAEPLSQTKQTFVQVRNARERNLKNISCKIPLQQFVTILGPSGSGKSTLLFDTVAEEAERRQAVSFQHQHLPEVQEKAHILGLPFTRALRTTFSAPVNETVGSRSAIFDALCVVWFELATRTCPNCKSEIHTLSREEFLEKARTLLEKDISILSLLPEAHTKELRETVLQSGFMRWVQNGELRQIDEEHSTSIDESLDDAYVLLDSFTLNADTELRLFEAVELGMNEFQNVSFTTNIADPSTYQTLSSETLCGTCKRPYNEPQLEDLFLLCSRNDVHGAQTEAEALSFEQTALLDALSLPLDELFELLSGTSLSRTASIPLKRAWKDVLSRLQNACEVGLGYLHCSRKTSTLSTGELQRTTLLGTIGAALEGVLYLLDEPSIGLHPDDCSRIIALIEKVVEAGNSVVAIEHDAQLIRASSYCIQIGPGSGKHGGDVIFEGASSERPTLQTPSTEGSSLVDAKDALLLTNCTLHNLDIPELSIPLRALVAVVGVSGSGKSTLIRHTLLPLLQQSQTEKDLGGARIQGAEAVTEVYDISELPKSIIGPRSIVATFCGVLDSIREIYAISTDAKVAGLTKKHFSFNMPAGRCNHCKGEGIEPGAHGRQQACSRCAGARYSPEVLRVRFKELNIAEALSLDIDTARIHFQAFSKIRSTLSALSEIGLGYLCLGQRIDSLSLGEQQRIKLLTRTLSRKAHNTLFLFDEPTHGLGDNEIPQLITLLRKLVTGGASVIVIEHEPLLVRACDHVIEIGPGSGKNGGQIIADGSPKLIKKNTASRFGRYL